MFYVQISHENIKSRKIFSATNVHKLAQTSNDFSLHNVFDGHWGPVTRRYLLPQPYSNFCQGYDTYFTFLQYFQKKSSHSLSQSYAQ